MSRRPGLGRGLDSLIPATDEESDVSSAYREVPIAAVRPNPQQPRSAFDQSDIDELAASISAVGLLQPLVVREVAGSYELVAGERRLRAATAAGVERVPVFVVDTDDLGSLERALVENIHRRDLNAIEEAAAYRQLLDDGGMTQEALADRLGRNRATIANSLRLLELDPAIQRFLIEGKLSAGHGKALLGLQGNPFQERVARRAAQEGMSVRETEDLVRRFQSMSPGGERARSARAETPQTAEAQRRLSEHLQTRVRVEMGKRKGKVVLDFVSLEELERLVALMTARGRQDSGL